MALPYTSAPGSITKGLEAIRTAAVPEKVSQDFVKEVLGVKGGSGNQLNSYLRKIGFADTGGVPTERYRAFRNASNGGSAVADAIRAAYQGLFARNEYAHKLNDGELRALIIQESGKPADSEVPNLILSCFRKLQAFASFDQEERTASTAPDTQENEIRSAAETPAETPSPTKQIGLSYTINLNLPATSDPAVFTAIFKSLKETLLNE